MTLAISRSGAAPFRQKWLRYAAHVVLVATATITSNSAHAQELGQTKVRMPEVSDLAKENQSYVAASAVDIEDVLRSNPGLMIQLKRWVAQEATQQGRLIGESDLTDIAIRERLRDDARFRGVATQLLQHFGYLTPRFDPNSDLARENEVLVGERAKRLAQEEEAAHRPPRQTYNLSAPCEMPAAESCTTSHEPTPNLAPEDGETPPPSEELPLKPVVPSVPAGRAPRVLETTSEHIVPNRTAVPGLDFAQELSPIPTDLDGVDSPFRSNRLTEPSNGLTDAQSGELRNSANIRPDEKSQPTQDQSAGDRISRSGGIERVAGFNSRGMIPKSDPYANIPSLVDMYMQASPQPGALMRFGLDVFQYGSRESQNLPMDLPVGPEYVVGPGDSLAVDLWGGVSQRLVRVVDREGRVSLPEVGPVLVSGKSLGEVQQTVQQTLRTQFRDVSADVSLARLRTVRVYVVGDVERPGAYDVSSLSTPLNALFVAGGPNKVGSLRVAEHYRGKQLIQEVDLYSLLLHGVKSDLVRLEDGDTILVPPIGPGVTIEGMVRRPAIYELRGEKNLAEAVSLAGGILPSAALGHIEVERVVDHEKRTMLSVSIPATASAVDVRKQLESFAVHDQDVIRIFPIVPYNQDAVYLEGHVLRPGRYAYREGMKLTDVIAGYSDLMPEPAEKYAEIIHLNPPDYRPSVESLSLREILAGHAASPVLKPMDTVRIFGKYDFEDVPAVSVWGEVREPGSYQIAGEVRLRDALHLAGGPTLDALMDSAQIFRALPDSTLKVFTVNLQEALRAEPSANVVLQPRDRIVVHRNPAKVDPPSVYVKGEIAKPGRYPLAAGMRVSELIRVGGGLRRSADTEIASLTEFRVNGSEQIISGERTINLTAALAGDSASDLPLRDGDTLTIRKIEGWDDRGASIIVRGEVQHPGTFGIQPGERLSSILERAGGFSAYAYPRGAVLKRLEVLDEEERSQHMLIERVQEEEQALHQLPENDNSQKEAKAAALAQWQRILDNLISNPPVGRLVIHISSNTRPWRNTADDIPVRAGDVLVIPKTPNFVMVSGQVYNPTAISYRPGRSAGWYLGQGGGPTHIADKKAIFVVRADGSVLNSQAFESLWRGSPLRATLQPGDTVVVPEKAVGKNIAWQSVFLAGQVASSVATAVLVAVHY